MKKDSIYNITSCALMAALLSVLGPISVPIGPVPISLTVFVIFLSLWAAGWRQVLISFIIYLLLGAFGLPVFSGFQGGMEKLAGPTGGYLAGFIPMILLCGLFMKVFRRKILPAMLGMGIGLLIAYTFGTVWFVMESGSTLRAALAVCVYPFIPFDLLKIGLSAAAGIPIRKALIKAGLLSDPGE